MPRLSGRFQQAIFVISSGRTGTKALAQHLGRCYEQVYAVHEPRPSWRLRRASAMALAGRLGAADLVKRLIRARSSLLQRVDRPIYLESNPHLGGFLETLGRVFDRPRLIHVVRDPRTYVRSGINWGSFRGLKYLANMFVPYWSVRPEHLARDVPRTWWQMTVVERLAWYWATINAELNRGESIYGPDYLRIRFEDLFARDGSGLQRLVSWIGLPWKPEVQVSANREKVNASRRDACPPWEQWTQQKREQVLYYCRDLMALYGYPVEEVYGRTLTREAIPGTRA